MQHELATDGPPPRDPNESEPQFGLTALRHAVPSFTVDVPDVNYELNKTELTKRVLALAAQQDRMANHIQGLPVHEDYDALVAEVAGLREKMHALELMLDSFVRRAA